jgi:hypothetical protein
VHSSITLVVALAIAFTPSSSPRYRPGNRNRSRFVVAIALAIAQLTVESSYPEYVMLVSALSNYDQLRHGTSKSIAFSPAVYHEFSPANEDSAWPSGKVVTRAAG